MYPILISPYLYGISFQPWVSVTGDNPDKVMEDFCKSTRYHSSWDWFMPVVKKCYKQAEDMEAEEWCCSIREKVVWADTNIVYGELIDFIKWYNKQKKT